MFNFLGYYFIDSNGKYFNHILEFLRHDTVPPDDVAYHVYKDACYYNLTRLAEKLQCSPSVAKIMVREANKTQFPDYYELREKIIRIAIQNAAVDKVGEVRPQSIWDFRPRRFHLFLSPCCARCCCRET